MDNSRQYYKDVYSIQIDLYSTISTKIPVSALWNLTCDFKIYMKE